MRMRNVLWLTCLIVGTTLSQLGMSQEPGDVEIPKPTGEQLTSWVNDLNAAQFIVRETATLKLIDAGLPVIDKLVNALPQSSPEATARIIHILRRLALDDQWSVNDPALEALQKIAKQEGTAAGRRASSTLLNLAEAREKRALEEIIKLGGAVTHTTAQFGLQFVQQKVLQIGENWTGTANDLKRLKWINSVQAVELVDGKARDSWMPHLVGMNNLQTLMIKRAAISDKGMESVAQLPGLQYLDVKYVPITNASLVHLQNLPKIQVVKLYGTNVTKEAAEKLQTVLPAADIDHRNGAFLGVGCPQPPEPCIITSIQPNTAAQEAGLRTGDWIVSFSGEAVRDFNDLKKLIGKWRPGDTTTVQVMRINTPRFGNIRKAAEVKADVPTEKHILGIKVTKLDEDSAWYKAGLRAEDVIHKLNGERIANAEALKTELTNVADGKLFQVIYYRQPKLKKYEIKLGEWK